MLPLPTCPTCGIQFSSAGIWRPRGDSRDVIVVFHGESNECDEVFGRVAADQGPLARLGSLGDYRGDITPIVREADFVFDLTAVSGPSTLPDE